MATPSQLINSIETGQYNNTFALLYGPGEQIISAQQKRYIEALNSFVKQYGDERDVQLYSTPGRTEIGGNHTDHNNGIVMAASVTLDIIAVVAQNNEHRVRVLSQGFGRPDDVDIKNLAPSKGEHGRSSALIRGIAAAIKARGGKVGGFDAYTTSNVLRGSGLSSSAAFEVCIGCIFNEEFNAGRFTPIEIGIIGQHAENVFFGKPSGLMDQLACAVGGAITINFKEPSKPKVEKVSLDLASYGYHLVITDTKGSHAGLTDEYAAIRSEMESVAAFFGKKVLCEVEEQALFDKIAEVRKKTGDRAVLRAIHFFAECRRVGQLAEAVKQQDFETFCALITAGGHSSFEYNQNAYSIKNPAKQGIPLALALSQKVLQGEGACRLQGGGFAGTIQAFVPDALLEEYQTALQNVFSQDACHVLGIRSIGCVQVTPGIS